MQPRQLLALVPVLVIALAVAVPAAVTAGTNVRVRVYDTAGLSPVERRDALAVAHATLSSASIDVTWEECAHRGDIGARCDAPLAPRDLAIRILRAPLTGGYGSSIPLGDALVEPLAGRAVFATIYFDRVERLAATAGTDARVLLGRAVAHELGHLLLATNTHSARGLMRAVWSLNEVRLGRGADWTFTAPDIAAIHARRRPVPLVDSAPE